MALICSVSIQFCAMVKYNQNLCKNKMKTGPTEIINMQRNEFKTTFRATPARVAFASQKIFYFIIFMEILAAIHHRLKRNY